MVFDRLKNNESNMNHSIYLFINQSRKLVERLNEQKKHQAKISLDSYFFLHKIWTMM